MNELDYQKEYWDRVASEKTFTHPIKMDTFREMVPCECRVLDYGCGYGRTSVYLEKCGYFNVTGVDISSEMIKRGLQLHNNLNLLHLVNDTLPFPNEIFAACTLLAVLTCIPTGQGQKRLIHELHRVLTPNGILYLSDYPLQKDSKNTNRYDHFNAEFGNYGIFKLPDGGVVRHHKMLWIYELLDQFEIIEEETVKVFTMNGSKATIFQIIAIKR